MSIFFFKKGCCGSTYDLLLNIQCIIVVGYPSSINVVSRDASGKSQLTRSQGLNAHLGFL